MSFTSVQPRLAFGHDLAFRETDAPAADVAPAPVSAAHAGAHRLPPLPPTARRFLALLALLFAAAVAARLHGSSSALWTAAGTHDIHPQDVRPGLLLSTPRKFRADEWNVWTPAMLNQARQEPPFPVGNATLGPGTTPLLMGLPARHYTMFFRPGLWGFFFLPFEFAFAWYWNAKVFGLFAAVFLLGWTLTGGRFGWAVFGAAAVQFSSFVQWWFSTPAMLPEMIACWAAGLVAALALFVPGGGWRRRALAAGALAYGGVGFVLCCYPAFAIPLGHVGACVLAGYLWQHRLWSWRGAAWLAGALAAAALALVPWVLDCLPTLRVEAGTVYPGQRHVYGGDMKLYRALSGLLNLAMEENRCPGKLINVCEGANFFPLWLLPFGLGVVACARFFWKGQGSPREWLRARGVKVALCAYLTAVTVYMFVKLPHWLCALTLIDRTYGRRCLLGMGIAGILLLVLSLADGAARRLSRRAAWAAGAAWTLGALGFLVGCRARFPGFLDPASTGLLAGAAAFLGVAYLAGPRWLLPVGWAAVFVAKTALINPLGVGLPELLDSPMLNRLREVVRLDPQAQWAVYNSGNGVELLKTTGARVINGLRIIPDRALARQFDPGGGEWEKFNRYSDLLLFDNPAQDAVRVRLRDKVFVNVDIPPRRLRERFPEVRYLASSLELPDAAAGGFGLLGHSEENRLWFYGLVDPRTGAPAVPPDAP